ncbi:MAG: S8 family serine peptidase, partial [Gammaproteobacteria bacterium]
GVVAASSPRDIGAELARDHDLILVAEWPLEALQQRGLEFLAVPDKVHERLAALAADPRLEDIQLPRTHHVSGMPASAAAERPIEDPYFDLQMRTQRRWVEPILRRGGGRGVRMAIIDTGVDTQHPDLVGQITEASNFVGGDPAMVPAEFHGTAVTGLVAARPGNGIGIHGLAPEAEIFALRACWEPTYAYGLCSTKTLAQALDYAIEIRARIINLSLAGPDDRVLSRLVDRAIELGGVVFGAVGDDPGQTFPASIPGVIAVRQTIVEGPQMDGAVLSVAGLQMLSTVPDGRYDFVSGPSFATAHASGVAAVMLDIEPHLRAPDLVDWLQRAHHNAATP